MASIGHAVHESSTRSTGLLNLLSRILLPLGLFAIALFGAGVNAAHAAKPDKVSSDLKKVLDQRRHREVDREYEQGQIRSGRDQRGVV